MDWSKLPEYAGYIVTILGAVYALALLIPGEQPDKTLKKILDITEKLSIKKK